MKLIYAVVGTLFLFALGLTILNFFARHRVAVAIKSVETHESAPRGAF
ncbi:MAG TPA: hypothetical protein VHT02_04280 [Methylocella sp.]|nr:hypothetical protein [Methylocella sp.]